MISRIRSVLIIVGILGFGMAPANAAVRRPLSPADYYEVLTVSDPQVSPDGRWVAYVVTSNDRDDMAIRLLAIHDGLTRILDEFRPDEAAVEATFVNKDAQATLKLGQARGIAMVVPARAGIPVAEYAPNVVKKSIVGSGHGDKVQVRMMIGVLLPKADPATHDAADALAIAVTHAHHRQSVVLRVAAAPKVAVR